MATKQTVTVIEGDGVGPEVIQSTLSILEAVGAPLHFEFQSAGASTGISKGTRDSILKNGFVLKGPLATPVGYGERSANVALRQQLQLFANIRPIFQLPGIVTPFSNCELDFVLIRENVEGLYTGMEYMQTAEVAESLKIVSREGCDRINRFAFNFAKWTGRKKVHCATKANILKFSEGLLKQSFEAMATRFPDIESHHQIVDNCAHQLVTRPQQFDVLVMSNMNGDILSDLASGLVGGLGVSPSVNYGYDCMVFEAVHGSAPDIAGKNLVNPTAMLLSAILMLHSQTLHEYARCIEIALHRTMKKGILTRDLASKGKGVSRSEFTQSIVDTIREIKDTDQDFGEESVKHCVTLQNFAPSLTLLSKPSHISSTKSTVSRVLGVDVFISSSGPVDKIKDVLNPLLKDSPFELLTLSNIGNIVYPGPSADAYTDHWRCRLMVRKDQTFKNEHLYQLLAAIDEPFHWMHLEKLLVIDGQKAFSD